jgi:hypothetical protein
MNGWELPIDVLAAAGGLLLLLILIWAAGERARAHRQWAWLSQEPHRPHRRHVLDWCMAMGATLGAL